MKLLLFSTLVLMFSCGYQKPQAKSSADTTTASVQVQPTPIPSIIDTLLPSSYNVSIYKEIIPAIVFELLDSELPGWTIPSPQRYEAIWFHSYKRNGGLVNYLKGDFNCDGIVDYCVQLEKDDKVTVRVLLSGRETYDALRLYENANTEIISFGLELIPKGKLYYLTFDDSTIQPPPIDLKCEAIQINYFETAARAHYWDKTKFVAVTTGD